jgi:hypothetical protein
MATAHRVYVFGDQTIDIDSSLRSLLCSNDLLLVSLFRRSYEAIRREVGRLPLQVRSHIPRFSSIADILSKKRAGLTCPALEQVTCKSIRKFEAASIVGP